MAPEAECSAGLPSPLSASYPLANSRDCFSTLPRSGFVQWRQAASDALVSLLEEQAAIAEFAGGLARAAAERQAWAEMIGKPDGAAR